MSRVRRAVLFTSSERGINLSSGDPSVFGIISTTHSQLTDDMPPLLGFTDVYGGISTFLSLLTNVTATSLIGQKAW